MADVSTLLTILTGLIGLPAAVWGGYQLLRWQWRRDARKNAAELADLEKEQNYLRTFKGYLEDLNFPLGYDEKEYTAPDSMLRERRYVALSYTMRHSQPNDQRGGVSPGSILPSTGTKRVSNALAVLKREQRPLILLGQPGSGKSVTLRHWGLLLAEESLRSNRPHPVIPIYIELGAYDQTAPDGEPAPVIELVRHRLKHVIPGGAGILENLDTILRQRRAVFLLDSMDEMPSADFSKRVEKLGEFITEHGSTNRVVIACREREYAGKLGHTELVIQPFDRGRIRQFLEAGWSLYKEHLPPEVREARYPAYMEIAEKDHPLADFASNPFSLKLLTRYFFTHGGIFSSRLAELLKSYVDQKLEIERIERKRPETWADRIGAVWSAMSFAVIEDNLGSHFRSEDLQRAQERVIHSTERELQEAIAVAVSCGLIRREDDKADTKLRFEHHRLLEYLAAAHWELHHDRVPITAARLENPWWRETLVLRAGLTRVPDCLIDGILPFLEGDRSTAAVADDPETAATGSIQRSRLDYLVTFEVAVACARERWEELDEERKERLLNLGLAIAAAGSVLEQVRVVRAFKGLSLDCTYPLLSELAGSPSDWLASEVLRAVDPKERASPAYGALVASFVRATEASDFIARLFAVEGVPFHACLGALVRFQPLTLLGLLGRLSLFWGMVLGLMVGVYWLGLVDPAAVDPSTWSMERWWRPIVPVTFFALLTVAFSGLRLGLIALGTFLLCLLIFPPQTSFRYYVCVCFYLISIGLDFKSSAWLGSTAYRIVVLGLKLSPFLRLILLYGIAGATSILVLHHLGLLQTVSAWTRNIVSIAVAAGIELALTAITRRSLRRRLDLAGKAADGAQAQAVADRFIAELRWPWPRWVSRALLSRLTELATDEPILIERLETLVRSGQHFAKNDDIMEAILRLDLRRRQKGLRPLPQLAPA